MAVDARAKKILLDYFWSSKGWRDEGARSISPDDRAHAMAAGLMAAPWTVDHDALLEALRRDVAAVSLAHAQDAFVASLSTRRLDLRSGLASRVLAAALEPHAYEGPAEGCVRCRGLVRYVDADLDVLQFERHKWGGVRHGDPLYMHVDLAALAREEACVPVPEDVARLQALLDAVAAAARGETPARLAARLAPVVESNKAEREMLVEILAAVGVLRASNPDLGCGEFCLAGAWRGRDGFYAAAVTAHFGRFGVAAKT